MAPRRKPPSTKSSLRGPSKGSRQDQRQAKPSPRIVSKGNTARRWRRDARPKSVRAAVAATKALRWNRRLIEAVLDELYVDDHFEELLGRAPGGLRPDQYARAIAIALILRHSWHPDDLACMLKRLKLRVADA